MVLTDGDDTVIAEAGSLVGTTIVDQGGFDVLEASLKAALADTTKIQGVEQMTFDWDAFGTASVDAKNFTGVEGGSDLTFTSSKVGFLGNATVTNAGNNNVTAGDGMVGTLTVSGVKDSVVDAGAAKSVVVNNAADNKDSVEVMGGAGTTTMTVGVGAGDAFKDALVMAGAATTTMTVNARTAEVTAGAATKTITVNGYDSATVEAAGATSVVLDDRNASAEAVVNSTASAVSVNTDDADGTLTLGLVDESVATVSTVTGLTKLIVTGGGDVTVKSDSIGDGEVENDLVDGTLTVESSQTGPLDVSDVSADLIRLTGVVNDTVTAANGSNFEITKDANALGFAVADDSNNDSVTVDFKENQTDGSTTFTNFETVNIVANAKNLTFAVLEADNKADAAAPTVNISGSKNVTISNVTTTANEAVNLIDASGLAGKLTVTTTTTGADLTISGAQGDTTVTFEDNSGAANTFVGQNANNEVNFQSLGITAQATAVFGSGNNKVTADIGALNNEDAFITVQAGNGNNTVELWGDVSGKVANIVLTFGTGTNTLRLQDQTNLSGDAVNFTATGLTTIWIQQAANDGDRVTMAASQLDGQSYNIVGQGWSLDLTDNQNQSILFVELADGGDSVDLSGLTASDGATTGAGIIIKGGDGDDTIVGTNSLDRIVIDSGENTVTGGGSPDLFTFVTNGASATQTTILDFDHEDVDKLDGNGIANATTALTDAAAIGNLVDLLNSIDGISDVTAGDLDNLFADANTSGATAFLFEFNGATHYFNVAVATTAFGNNDDDVFITLAGVTGIETTSAAGLIFA